MTLSPVHSVAFQGGPPELGTLSVGPDGELLRTALIPLAFTFALDGIEFVADAHREGPDAILHIISALGPMPYSAEGLWRRVDLDYMIGATRQRRDGRLLVDHGKLLFEATVKLGAPLTPVTILTAATEIIIRAKKLIDLARLYTIPVKSTKPALTFKSSGSH